MKRRWILGGVGLLVAAYLIIGGVLFTLSTQQLLGGVEENKVVTFPCPNLEAGIRRARNKIDPHTLGKAIVRLKARILPSPPVRKVN